MNIEVMQSQVGKSETLLKILANRRRLTILCELWRGECSVGELEGPVGLSQSALSQHLAKLRRARVVSTRRKSRTIYYRLADSRVRAVIGALYELYCGPLRHQL